MKKLSFLLVVLFTLTVAEARPISEQEAWQKAYQFFGNVGLKRMNKAKAKTPLKKPELTLAVSRDEFYVFNDDANGGYVIVSGDERLPNFLGYSYDGHFNADNIPCNVQAWLEGYVDQIRFLQEHPETCPTPRQEVVKDIILPLLNCHWNQRNPYNERCPIIEGAHSLTGCVATAMAQVMYYYQWPEQTTQPIPGYTTKKNKITVPEQPVTRIDWQNMLPVYQYGQYSDKQADAVAQLMLLCGASVKIDYGLYGSGGNVSAKSFEDYFDYYGGQEIYRYNFDFQAWCQLLYEELKKGHPVLYSGHGDGGEGHQFVLDGYDVVDDGETTEAYYHVNFGWAESNDAYFSLNNVNGFNYGQSALVGLRPNDNIQKFPYAVLDEGKMTFFYDSKKKERSGQFFSSGLPWDKQTITECEFDASFADYKMMDCSNLFNGCVNLRSIKGWENLHTENVTNMAGMFYGCSSLTSLDISGFNTENVTNMNCMFGSCSSLTNLDVKGFNTKNVRDMADMFSDCSNLKSLDLSGFNTENVTSMARMFSDCSNLKSLDLSGFDTHNVTNMESMFANCSNLKSLDLSGFDTHNVTHMICMFYNCSNLKSLDVSRFNTENVTDMSWMFGGCSNLTSLDLSRFNTKNVTNMSCMFVYCSSLTNLDVKGFNTENVTDMSYMFFVCFNLTSLDISGFNTEKVTNMGCMFYVCSKLTTIYATNRWSTGKVAEGSDMFTGCDNLVGGKGTKYNYAHTDHSYARIDGGPEAPGYFTEKEISGIKNLLSNEDKEKSIYSLGGQRLPTPQKGINIIGGKKVMVRSTPFLGR